MEIKISIITASYNYQDYIKETIESVIAQTYSNWEMIIVDDGSVDNSVEVIKQYCQKDKRIKLYQHENGCNKGLAETIKLGISKANSDWLMFVESDDTITPDYIEKKLQVIKQNPDVKFIFNDVNMFGDTDRIRSMQPCFEKLYNILAQYHYPANLAKELKKRNLIPTFSCVMLRKELFKNIDFDKCVLKPCLDFYLWAQISKKYDLYYLPEKLTNWRMSKTSYINKKEDDIKVAYFYNVQIPDLIDGKSLWRKFSFGYEIFRNYRRKFFRLRLNKNKQMLVLFGVVIFNNEKSMKLGISYNLFDGEELLESSLKSVRKAAYHINVVYQKESYYGNKASEGLENLLKKLKREGLIDEIYLYQNKSANKNKLTLESEKRDIGLRIAKNNGCTHFLSMDVDEFYDEQQLENAKKFIIRKRIDSSACSVVEYLKEPIYKMVDSYAGLDKGCNFYVPFIMKIYRWKFQKHNNRFFPCWVDPSRALNNDKRFYLFTKQIVEMHHMSTVRKSLDKKYKNSNLNRGKEDVIRKINKIKQDILNWDFGDNVLQGTNYALFKDKIIEKVENRFDINIEM